MIMIMIINMPQLHSRLATLPAAHVVPLEQAGNEDGPLPQDDWGDNSASNATALTAGEDSGEQGHNRPLNFSHFDPNTLGKFQKYRKLNRAQRR